MGWGQPNTGKRCRDSAGGDEHHQAGYLASESETDEELRAHLMNKRSRDVSPVRLTQGNIDLTRGDCSKSSDLVLADSADSSKGKHLELQVLLGTLKRSSFIVLELIGTINQ